MRLLYLRFMLLLRSARALHHIARPALRRTHLLATRSELEALTVPVLKDRLRSLSLKVGGKKGELVERLLESEQDANGAAAAEAEPVVVDGVRVIDVGDDYDWGFDDDDDGDEDAGTDMADRLARASAGDVGHGGARASHDERRGAPDFAIEVGAGNCGGCGAPFQCQDEARTGYVPPSVYARLNLAGEDDDSPEAEVERLLAEARAGRQEAEVEVDEEDLAMDEEEFEELLQELEAVWKSNLRRPVPLLDDVEVHESPNSLVDFHTGRCSRARASSSPWPAGRCSGRRGARSP